MIAEIRAGIVNFLKAQGLDVKEFDFKDLKNRQLTLRKPTCNIFVNKSGCKKVTASFDKTKYKYVLVVSVVLVVNYPKTDPASESLKRQAAEELMEAIGNDLLGQDFDLQMQNPLFPMGFVNITTPDWQNAGYIVFQQDFWCSFILEKLEADAPLISSVLASYFLKPQETNAEPPQAQDSITGTL